MTLKRCNIKLESPGDDDWSIASVELFWTGNKRADLTIKRGQTIKLAPGVDWPHKDLKPGMEIRVESIIPDAPMPLLVFDLVNGKEKRGNIRVNQLIPAIAPVVAAEIVQPTV